MADSLDEAAALKQAQVTWMLEVLLRIIQFLTLTLRINRSIQKLYWCIKYYANIYANGIYAKAYG